MSTLWHNWLLYGPLLREGAWTTLRLSLSAMGIALLLGVLGSLGRLSPFLPARIITSAYVEIFRGTPFLLQLYVSYFVVVGWLQDHFNYSPDSFLVGALTLAINYGAYLTEVFRAGILAIDRGQHEAAQSLGMRSSRIFRRIVFPQAFRVVIPPLANNFITLIQDSSYLVAISLEELTHDSEAIAAGNDLATRWQVYAFAGALYFVMCYPVAVLARHTERRLRGRVS